MRIVPPTLVALLLGLAGQAAGQCNDGEDPDGDTIQTCGGRGVCQDRVVVDCDDNCPFDQNGDQANVDNDAWGDACDNCAEVPNDDQNDRDGDGHGDACDDSDEDGIVDANDNCPDTSNPEQAQTGGDADIGDACEDRDGDGVVDTTDNCPDEPNESQTNTPGQRDNPARGDACDDRDLDGVVDRTDNCLNIANPGQVNSGGDPNLGLGDACDDRDGDGFFDANDNCPAVSNPSQVNTLGGDPALGDHCEDRDRDTIDDAVDNCIAAPNRPQADRDGDGLGDSCDDSDADGVVDAVDNCFGDANLDQDDLDDDGIGDPCDADRDGDGLDNLAEPGFDRQPDRDNDGVPDGMDNCVGVANPSRTDTGGDPALGDACEDRDEDAVLDAIDNCPDHPNPADIEGLQPDREPDTPAGAACEDSDGDGIVDALDNCWDLPNADQLDHGGSDLGDACDDRDTDQIFDLIDNCPLIANPGQANTDGVGPGDACEDRDGDAVVDAIDNCPDDANPADGEGVQLDRQPATPAGAACEDSDEDGFMDAVDNCWAASNPDQADDLGGLPLGDACDDQDGDGSVDSVDNCPLIANADQANADNAGPGDACDDRDGDGVVDTLDNCPDDSNPADVGGTQLDRVLATAEGAVCEDSDGDGVNDAMDNCWDVSNALQIDSGGLSLGDACDDRDSDGVLDHEDNCPDTSNSQQHNVINPGDSAGDACDDPDEDGFADRDDNCPALANADQSDLDVDGVGDLCDPDLDDDGLPNLQEPDFADQPDRDGDRVLDGADNCPNVANAGQTDGDQDGQGDACDDSDGDSVVDAADNCVTTRNPNQADSGGDPAQGDACDDRDADGTFDASDNCIQDPNPDQSDGDGNGVGDVCDDRDQDMIVDAQDNCVEISNRPQADSDGDGEGDACDDSDGDDIVDLLDNCPTVDNPNQGDQIDPSDEFGDACGDTDGDGHADAVDNCPHIANVDQADTPGGDPKYGDACEDRDRDRVMDSIDNCVSIPNSDQTNSDEDVHGDACDDSDRDGVNDDLDNCRSTPNGQQDLDEDGQGDACDPDIDGDGIGNRDEHGHERNPDRDGDGVLDGDDTCPDVPNPVPDGGREQPNACEDTDRDGVIDSRDLCPFVADDQVDLDGDGLGDACDPDRDNDGIPNAGEPGFDRQPDRDGDGIPDGMDNCPNDVNPLQGAAGPEDPDGDYDGDGIGNACEFDDDGDGIPDDLRAPDVSSPGDLDNCPFEQNPAQLDVDEDGSGDACDLDDDGDGVPDDSDNCPRTANPFETDGDGDGIGDVCDPDQDGDGIENVDDNCPSVGNPAQANLDRADEVQDPDRLILGDACDPDVDGDGVLDAGVDTDGDGDIEAGTTDVLPDNCPREKNPDQADLNADGNGDACEDDIDNDEVLNEEDNCPYDANARVGEGQLQLDHDGDGQGDACDGDIDGDGRFNRLDVCPTAYDPLQRDTDGDGVGDACDDDDDSAEDGALSDVAERALGTRPAEPNTDGDAFEDAVDLCPRVADDGADLDQDGQGDACDADDDGDNVPDEDDNCPRAFNPWQVGDSCDDEWSLAVLNFDSDGDGVQDTVDLCPDVADDQSDLDRDGVGDACDDDRDGDGRVRWDESEGPRPVDPFIDDDDSWASNRQRHLINGIWHDLDGPRPQHEMWAIHTGDLDRDGILDEEDACRLRHNPNDQDGLVCATGSLDADRDGDGIINSADVCPATSDSEQNDRDGDGIGDACDMDRDGDGIPEYRGNGISDNRDLRIYDYDGPLDLCPDHPSAQPNGEQPDLDDDGFGDACDEDVDGDGWHNAIDNCPRTSNAAGGDGLSAQLDQDGDGVGDACDADEDGDGYLNEEDTCPRVWNPDQRVVPTDDAPCGSKAYLARMMPPMQGLRCPDIGMCEVDRDDDGVLDSAEVAEWIDVSNHQVRRGGSGLTPSESDWDGDGLRNDDDPCPRTTPPAGRRDTPFGQMDLFPGYAESCAIAVACGDIDGDGVADYRVDCDADGVPELADTCPGRSNPPIEHVGPTGRGIQPLLFDRDQDGIEDSCDRDQDGDGLPEFAPPGESWPQCRPGCHLNGSAFVELGCHQCIDNCPFVPNRLQLDADGDGEGDACDADPDDDGWMGEEDWCPLVADDGTGGNIDDDGDGLGAGCDRDRDGDGVPESGFLVLHRGRVIDDLEDDYARRAWLAPRIVGDPNAGVPCVGPSKVNCNDNCPGTSNPNQLDFDGDGVGDACDDDIDGDDIPNESEPLGCVRIHEDDTIRRPWASEQAEHEKGCSVDADADGVPEPFDNCPGHANQALARVSRCGGVECPPLQWDADQDGIGDACDGLADGMPDADGDGVEDMLDNCPYIPNATQENLDQDAEIEAQRDPRGDACDSDIDGDGLSQYCESGCHQAATPQRLQNTPLISDASVGDQRAACLVEVGYDIPLQCATYRDDGSACPLPPGVSTDPRDSDTDGDGLSDADEVDLANGDARTDPRRADTDGDCVPDDVEIGGMWFAVDAVQTPGACMDSVASTSPVHWDSDGDGLSDGDEAPLIGLDGEIPDVLDLPVQALSDPTCRDSDGDGLSDRQEAMPLDQCGSPGFFTDPLHPDTDGDGFDDRQEVEVADVEAGVLLCISNPVDVLDRPDRPVRGELTSGCTQTPAGGSSGWLFGLLLLAGLSTRRGFGGRASTSALVLALAGSMIGPAQAQTSAYSRPSTVAQDPTVVGGASIVPFRQWSAGGGTGTLTSAVLPHLYADVVLAADYVQRPLVLGPPQRSSEQLVVAARTDFALSAGLGLFDLVEFRVHLPVHIEQAEAGYEEPGLYESTGLGDAVGDVSLMLKGGVLDEREWPVGVAVVAMASVPTGDASLHSDGNVVPEGRVVVEASDIVPRISVLGNVGGRYRRDASALAGDQVGPEFNYAATVGLDVYRDAYSAVRTATLLAEFRGAEGMADGSGARQVVLGARVAAGAFTGRLGLGFAPKEMNTAPGVGSYGVFAGLGWRSTRDRDGDSVEDALDRCPEGPEDYDGFEDTDGCSEPDNDGDGIPDTEDGERIDSVFGACRDEPEDRDGFQDLDGCPEEDNDEDALPDADDDCPDRPEDYNGIKDDDGCPDGDTDGDDYLDVEDDCPDTPCVPGRRCEDGCPDSDEDGFLDRQDVCPEEACRVDEGCHLGCRDRDRDSVPDKDDKCIGQKEDELEGEAPDGCPGEQADRDGDEVPDKSDRCPDRPDYVKVNFAGRDGCPQPDRDRDGVPDEVDACPEEPEDLYSGRIDGCPGLGAATPEAPADDCPTDRDDLPDTDGDFVPDCRDQCPDRMEDDAGEIDGCPEV